MKCIWASVVFSSYSRNWAPMFSGKSRILAEEMNSWWTFVSVLVEDDDILLTKQVHSGIDFIVRFACLLLLLLCFFFFLIFIQNLTSHLHNHSCLLQAGKKKTSNSFWVWLFPHLSFMSAPVYRQSRATPF